MELNGIATENNKSKPAAATDANTTTAPVQCPLRHGENIE